MSAIGIDYGTTTSWIVTGGEDGVITKSLTSSCFLGKQVIFGDDALSHRGEGNSYIRSPKSYIANGLWNKFPHQNDYKLEQLISDFVKKLLSYSGIESNDGREDDVHITFTVPNCYKGNQITYFAGCLKSALEDTFTKYKYYLLSEPIAAALYYVFKECKTEKGNIVVCDMGGGTTDIAVVSFEKNSQKVSLEVVATVADSNLGGDLIDGILLKKLKNLGDIEEKLLPAALEEVKLAKEELVENEFKKTIRLQKVVHAEFKGDTFESLGGAAEGERGSFLRKFQDLLSKLHDVLRRRDKKLDNIILLPVGGSMKIPSLREKLVGFFKTFEDINIQTVDEIEPYKSIVMGAMLYSAFKSGKMTKGIKEVEIKGRFLYPISVETMNKKLSKIVDENSPDGDYSISLRPCKIKENKFYIDELKFYYTDTKEVTELEEPCFEISVNKEFDLNGKDGDDVEISLTIKIEKSLLKSVSLTIENNKLEYNPVWRK